MLPFVQNIAVRVAGSGQSLSSYISASCAPPAFPSGPGALVLSQTGSGFATTDPFKVHSKRWTVAFDNRGRFFQAFLLKKGATQPQVVAATKRGVGSMTFTGAGTFQLKIAGSGNWIVRVHDGARHSAPPDSRRSRRMD
jgi:hypothetical protein